MLQLKTGKSGNCLHSVNIISDKVFKNGPSKIWGRQPSKIRKGYGLLETDHIPSNLLKALFHKFYLVHSWIRSIFVVGSCDDGLRISSKSNETGIIAQSYRGRETFFLARDIDFLPWFMAGAGSFLCWKFAFFNYHIFHLLSELNRCKEKLCHFLRFKASITIFSIEFFPWESLFS